ncbi:OTU-domain-containing protein [Fomitiporia mediterranea MF3/22]|uniref:OTU-domain-containing protein n=1 Tax=Fomitiporia mediterranea (strain MF3/22) TaxID=694068 RepID=UPI0004407EA4|nr:OTU-domain-containing protein [Fomitiporia mediterranea MF3/22]EJD02481.1 OTU-domain-containing protein [Fomitiporia mediterranea MF3/22]
MSMAKIRLRHPRGQSTIDIDLNSASVQDLQQQIRAISDVLPSQQELKYGYPPRQLTLVPELPVSSLGLKSGDQIILTQGAVTTTTAAHDPAPPNSTASNLSAQATASRSTLTPPLQSAMSFEASQGGPDYVPTDAGILVHRVVPDDNSCLFSCIALVFEQDIGKAQAIRKTVADAIRQDAETWTEAMLGLPREQYIQNILKPSSWGGAIELSILAKYYSTEIASIDVETGRIDRFEPTTGKASTRCILIYSGIHYDAASIAPMVDAPPDFHQTVFPIEGEDAQTNNVLGAASKLADKLRAKRAYTNTATFDLRCEICKAGLKGEKGAREHAMQTGHTAFGEY